MVEYVDTYAPHTGRFLAETGEVVNVVDLLRSLSITSFSDALTSPFGQLRTLSATTICDSSQEYSPHSFPFNQYGVSGTSNVAVSLDFSEVY